ncbi:MAG: hypothetical protein HDQ95_10045 [Roseburia sp.]|nr:hypothetical protein [Roseburia sp.]
MVITMLREELKKIWRPGMILLLVFLGCVFYSMFLEFYIRYFPNGPHAVGVFQVGAELVERYGTSLSKEEAAELEQELPKLYERADMYVKGFELAKKYGLSTYEEYLNFCNDTVEALADGEAADLNEAYADSQIIDNYLISEETGNISGRIYGTECLLRFYHTFLELGPEAVDRISNSEREHENAEKMLFGEDKLWQNILPDQVPEVASTYLGYLLVWMCLSVCLLLSPLQVHDRMSRMRALQYSSKRGRSIFLTQFYAVMLSAFLLTTGNLVLFGGIFATNGTDVFASCRMFSFASSGGCWPNWTYKGWWVALILLCYLVAMGTAAISFFLSGYSSHYIAMLLKLIPVFTVVAILSPMILYRAFYYGNMLYHMTGVPYVEAGAAGVIFAAGVALCVGAYRHRLTASLADI